MTDNDNGPVLGEDGAELFEELGSGSSPQNTPALPPNASYRNAALDAVNRGWTVFPLAFSTKDEPKTKWRDVNTTDPAQVRAWWKAGRANIGIATGESNLYVVDVDMKPGKVGKETWAALVLEHGHTPTYTVTTATGGLHFYYRMPETRLRNSESDRNGLGRDVDTRGDGGYVVGAGSVIGLGAYHVTENLPVADLPQWISERMIEQGRGPRQPRDTTSGVFGDGADGAAGEEETLARVRELAQKIVDADEGSGNTTLNEIGFKVGNYVGAGQITYEQAAEILTEALSTWTFTRGDEGKQYTQLLDALADGSDVRDRPWAAAVGVGLLEAFDPGAEEPTERPGMLSEEFWASRPILGHIRQAAHSRGRCGDLVLLATMARLSGMVSHRTKLDAGMGQAVPNLFVAAVGRSGTGKSTSSALAGQLVPVPDYLAGPDDLFLDGVAVGSGEGLAEMFMGEATVECENEFKADGVTPKTKKIRTQVRHNAYVFVDEGQALTAQSSRAGATIGPILRSAWAGQLLGQQNATVERTRKVPAGAYSLGMVIGFQRDTAQPLFQEIEAGTPQRFIWVSATDPAIPDEAPEWPGELPMHHLGDLFGSETVITYDDQIKELLWTQNLKVARGLDTGHAMDAHLSLMAMKLSGLLALMDARFHVTWEDWKLAGAIWRTSCVVRNDLMAFGQEQEAAAHEAVVERAVSQAMRTAVAVSGVDRTVSRVGAQLARKIHVKGSMSHGYARKELAGRDKPMFSEALEYAQAQGWLVVTDSKVSPGDAVPEES